MRKILIVILIIILIAVGYFMIMDGMQVFGIEIISVMKIKEKNEQLDTKLQEVSVLSSTQYPAKISELNNSSKELSKAKNNYADLVAFSSTEDIISAREFEKYETEYIWTKIGNHATKNGVVLKLEVKNATSGVANQYDLYFTATGKYVSISEFITSVEDDSSFKFKIENFRLIPTIATNNNTEVADTTTLQATFIVKNVAINLDKLSTTNNSSTSTNNQENTVVQDENTVDNQNVVNQ